jgi:hypothetical protein
MSIQMRLSPSGAPIAGNAAFNGLQLRLAEANVSCATLALTTGFAPLQNTSLADIVVSLPNPEAAKKYKLNAMFFLDRLAPTSAQVQARASVRYNGVGAWTPFAFNSRTDAAGDGEGKSLFPTNFAAKLGSSPELAVPAGATLIEVRLEAQASAAGAYSVVNDGGSGVSGGLVFISLAELNA